MCVRCGTGRIAMCTDPFKHGDDDHMVTTIRREIMDLTEDQLTEAKEELARREREKARAYQAEYYRKLAEAEERFWTGMLAKYPGVTQETMYDIYSECRDYFD